jgi:hypothetical protein
LLHACSASSAWSIVTAPGDWNDRFMPNANMSRIRWLSSTSSTRYAAASGARPPASSHSSRICAASRAAASREPSSNSSTIPPGSPGAPAARWLATRAASSTGSTSVGNDSRSDTAASIAGCQSATTKIIRSVSSRALEISVWPEHRISARSMNLTAEASLIVYSPGMNSPSPDEASIARS